MAIRINTIEPPFYQLRYRSSGGRGQARELMLPFQRARVDSLPKGVSAIVLTSDLQGRELDGRNRLLGERVAEELTMLCELGEIPEPDLILLAGDFYDYPDCRKMGGTGEVTSVWNTFAYEFMQVVGVLGNHDVLDKDALRGNARVLDGDYIHRVGLSIGGVSGIIGKPSRNQRKTDKQFVEALEDVALSDIVLLHQGPNDPESGQRGDTLVRQVLLEACPDLAVFGHCHWHEPMTTIGRCHAVNVDARVVICVA